MKLSRTAKRSLGWMILSGIASSLIAITIVVHGWLSSLLTLAIILFIAGLVAVALHLLD
jgi:hypothetical protein